MGVGVTDTSEVIVEVTTMSIDIVEREGDNTVVGNMEVGVGVTDTSGVTVEVLTMSVDTVEIVDKEGDNTVVGNMEDTVELEVEESIEILVREGIRLEILGVKVRIDPEIGVETP